MKGSRPERRTSTNRAANRGAGWLLALSGAALWAALGLAGFGAIGAAADETAPETPAGEEVDGALAESLGELQELVARLRKTEASDRDVDDIAVHAKGAEWIIRHRQFDPPASREWTRAVIARGLMRGSVLEKTGKPPAEEPGRQVQAYRSAVDDSVQPYAVALPAGHNVEDSRRWPLHVVLHGRNDKLTEVSFFQEHLAKPVPAAQDFIELHVFGRTNNGYRWAGESDVFEAMADVKRRYRVDELRVVLHGFSMGGAGAWHLGLHFPTQWCAVGAGAGFVDFYRYQNVSQPLPFYQHETLHLYDAVDVALNLANVPFVTYSGELDKQRLASTTMQEAAEKLKLPLTVLVGPKTEHAFHPESQQEFMRFLREHEATGRDRYPDRLRFVTYSLKHNACGWLTIEEMVRGYRPAVVETERDGETGRLKIRTENVGVLQLARDLAEEVELDGQVLPLSGAADGLLPGVYYESSGSSWRVLSYDSSLSFPKNQNIHKRHNLQGPIDDAFTQPFVCVLPTGTAWHAEHAAWSKWTLERFQREYDRYLRGAVPVINDTDVTAEVIASKHLIVFGDPGSNGYLSKVIGRLPLQWTKNNLVVNGEKYDPATHGVSLVYPNPLNARRYVVLNSGHTFHAADFQKSNAWLFPRLGDIAVQRFEADGAGGGGYRETVVWADLFNSYWKLPSGLGPARGTP